MEELIIDLYNKYAPGQLSQDKINYIKSNYGNDLESFVKDFYRKYAPSENADQKWSYIQENYLKKKDEAFPLSSGQEGISSDIKYMGTGGQLAPSPESIWVPKIDERGYTAAGETYAAPVVPPAQIREQVAQESGAAQLGTVGAVLKPYLPKNFESLTKDQQTIAMQEAASKYQANESPLLQESTFGVEEGGPGAGDVIMGSTKEMYSKLMQSPQTIAAYFLSDEDKEKVSKLEDPAARWALTKGLLMADEDIPMAIKTLMPASWSYQALGKEGAEQQAEVMDQYDRGVTQYIIDGEYGNAGKLAFYQAMASLPTMAAAMVPGGQLALGLSSFADFTIGDIERGETLDLNDLMNNITKAGAEAFWERYTGKLGNRALGQFMGKRGASDAAAKSITSEILKGFGLGVAEEGGSEAATAVTQLLSDAIFAGREVPMVEAMKQISDAFLVGGLMGGPLSGAGAGYEAAKKKVANEIASKSDKETLRKNTEKKAELTKARAEAQDPAVVNTIDELIEAIDNNSADIEAKLKATVDNMTDEEVSEVTKLKREAENLAIKAQQLKDDPNLDESSKATALEVLKQQASAAIQKRQTIIDNAVQKQTTSEVPVQPKARVGEEVAQGAPKAKPEIVTEEGVQEEEIVEPPKPKEGVEKIESLGDEETITFNVSSPIFIPAEFADRAEEKDDIEIGGNELMFGVPIGKQKEAKIGKGYSYTLTGKEAKEYIRKAKEDPYFNLSQPSEDVEAVPPTVITSSDRKVIEDAYESETDEVTKGVYKDVLASFKVLKSIMPDLEIHLYNSNADYVKSGNPGGSVGNMQENIMSINIEAAKIARNQADITKHEAVHPIMQAIFENNPEVANKLYAELSTFKRGEFKRAAQHAIDFGNQYQEYGDAVVKMEAIVEFCAIVASRYDVKSKKDANLVKKLKGFITMAAELFGFKVKVSTEQDIVNVAKAISYAFIKGEDVANVLDIEGTYPTLKKQVDDKVGDFVIDTLSKFGISEAGSDKEFGLNEFDKANVKEENKKLYESAKKKVTEVSKDVKKRFLAKMKKPSALSDRQNREIGGVVKRALERGNTRQEAIDAAQAYLENSPTFLEADDITREQMLRDFKYRFYQKIKKAPSVAKVLSPEFFMEKLNAFFPQREGEAISPKKKKVTVDEASALKDQIRREAKAAKDAVAFMNSVRKSIANAVTQMQKSNKISSRKAQAIINKMSKINLTNPDAVDNLIDYIERVFSQAKYLEDVSKANSMRKSIKKLSKNDKLQSETSMIAKQFAKIDPNMIENLEEYLEMAEKVLDAIRPSKIRIKEGVADADMKQAMVYDEMYEYISKTIGEQERTIAESLMKIHSDLVEAGVINKDMSLEDMTYIIDALRQGVKEEDIVENKKILRDFIRKAFDSYAAVMREIAKTDIDPLTGESLGLSGEERLIAMQFSAINTDYLSTKEAVAALDAMNNFLVNGNVDGMEASVKSYTGALNSKRDSKIMKAKAIRYLGNTALGRFMFRNFGQIQLVFEAAFKDPVVWNQIALNSGFREFTIGKTKAHIFAKKIEDKYNEKFKGIKDFHSPQNTYERGMYAFVLRTISDTEVGKKKEFDRQKRIIEESILGRLEHGTDEQKKYAEIELEVYNKILKDSNNIQEVTDKISDFNKDAVNFWVDVFKDKFDDFQKTSRSVHNLILSNDMYYTPQRWSIIGEGKAKDSEDLTFIQNGQFFYDKKAGSFMERNTSLTSIPRNTDKTPSRGVNLEFDTMIFNAFLEAMVDSETAASVKQMDGYFETDGFASMVESTNDRKLMREIIKEFISESKKGNYVPATELREITKWLDDVSAFGTARALASITQPVLQTIPVMVNTLVNAGRLDLGAWSEAQDWLRDNGYEIAVRGLTSRADVQSIKSLIKMQEEGKTKKFIRGLREFNEKALELGLGNFDKWIAEVSWISYYKQNLKKRGLDIDNIDWSSHTPDPIAAEYAQSMVNRNQNISDIDQIGKVFKDKRDLAVLTRKMAFAFASFGMNQKMRMAVDAKVLRNRDGNYTDEQKSRAIRSLAATGLEMASFRGLQLGIGYGLFYLGKEIVRSIGGDDEEELNELFPGAGDIAKEEEFAKWFNSQVAYATATSVYDIMSPLPATDPAIANAWNLLADIGGFGEDAMLPEPTSGTLRQLGTYGVAAEKLYKMTEMINLAATGEFEYDSRTGKKKMYIDEGDMELETTAAIIYSMYALGLIPESVLGKVANNMHNSVKKRAVSKTDKFMSWEEREQLQENLEVDIDKMTLDKAKKIQEELKRREIFLD